MWELSPTLSPLKSALRQYSQVKTHLAACCRSPRKNNSQGSRLRRRWHWWRHWRRSTRKACSLRISKREQKAKLRITRAASTEIRSSITAFFPCIPAPMRSRDFPKPLHIFPKDFNRTAMIRAGNYDISGAKKQVHNVCFWIGVRNQTGKDEFTFTVTVNGTLSSSNSRFPSTV